MPGAAAGASAGPTDWPGARADEEGEDGGVAETALDLVEVAAEVVAEHVPQSLARGVEVQFERPGSAVPIVGEKVLVRELVASLLENAIRYNRAGGMVALRVTHAVAGNRVEIDDDGPGISPAERATVFKRFYRVPRKDSSEGSGLGLAILRAPADRCGAAITLNDRPEGPGLRVDVVFRAPGTPSAVGRQTGALTAMNGTAS